MRFNWLTDWADWVWVWCYQDGDIYYGKLVKAKNKVVIVSVARAILNAMATFPSSNNVLPRGPFTPTGYLSHSLYWASKIGTVPVEELIDRILAAGDLIII